MNRSLVAAVASTGLLACTPLHPTRPDPAFPTAPYPHSRSIPAVKWDFSTLLSHRKAHGSDLWPCAWAADSRLYCAFGDGGGFDGDSDTVGRVSLGFARIDGVPDSHDPDSFSGRNVWGAAPAYAEHPATFGGKVATMISIDGTLYAYGHLWTERDTPDPVHRSSDGPLHTLIWSEDLGATWQIAPWSADESGSFLEYGADNAGAPDSFVYIYYERPGDATHVYLKRVPKTRLRDDPATSEAYQYMTGVNWFGRPRTWSVRERDASPVFFDPRGADVLVVYDAPIRRYLMTSAHNPGGELASASAGQIGLFEAPHPWGPWSTVGYYDDWGGLGPESHGDSLGLVLPAKWISPDGRHLWAIFSSLGQYDAFNLVSASLTLRANLAR